MTSASWVPKLSAVVQEVAIGIGMYCVFSQVATGTKVGCIVVDAQIHMLII